MFIASENFILANRVLGLAFFGVSSNLSPWNQPMMGLRCDLLGGSVEKTTSAKPGREIF
jgi:hypothetical protein